MVRITSILVWLLGSCPAVVFAEHTKWERIRVGSGEIAITAVYIDPNDSHRLFVATHHALFESKDGGQYWREHLRLPSSMRIRRIAVESAKPSSLLISTNHGLYGSFDGGEHWTRVFRPVGEGQTDCGEVAFHPSHPEIALVASLGGLFVSGDHGHHWHEADIPQAARHLSQFIFDPVMPERLYLVSSRGVFVGTLSGGRWRQLLGKSSAEEPGVEASASLDTIETDEENGDLHRLSTMAVDPQHPTTLYLATSKGVRRSLDSGVTWQLLTSTGLQSIEVSRLIVRAHSPSVLYAVTQLGIARYEPRHDRWKALNQGAASSSINDVAVTSAHLWIATAHGLYRTAIPPELQFDNGQVPSLHDLMENFSYEPTITQVREAAIRYAEVHPSKIIKWRRQASLKALLPTVGFDLDQDRSQDVHIDEGTFPHYQLIDSQNQDTDASYSIRWDLSNLIWNNDQTTIDTRSKLMVELRNELTDQVTRTYFERRRLQIALLTAPPQDEQQRLEQELRIQELTALIDGLTGGYFSQHLPDTGTQQEEPHGAIKH